MDPCLLSFTELADQRTAFGLFVGLELSHSGALNGLPGHREGPTPAVQRAAPEGSFRPGLAPHSEFEQGELFSPSQPLAPHLHLCVQVPEALAVWRAFQPAMLASTKGIHSLTLLFIHSWGRRHREVKTLTWENYLAKNSIKMQACGFIFAGCQGLPVKCGFGDWAMYEMPIQGC